MYTLKKGNQTVQVHHMIQIYPFKRIGFELVEEENTKEELWEELLERGIEFDKRWGIEKLQELLNAKK